jgi:Calcineurin-like phosphoesterase
MKLFRSDSRSKGRIALGLLILVVGIAGTLILSAALSRVRASESGDPVLIGAGDIASCNSTGDEATAKLLDSIPGTIFLAGDDAYDSGTAQQFADCYDPSWGRFKDRTRPAVGNHEYITRKAQPYFDYFGTAAGDPTKGYYSYELGKWHIVVINSNCSQVAGCGAGSPQEQWLRDDLRAHPADCTLAYWHHPRFSSGEHGDTVAMQPIWQALYDAGAELVINGHDHDYERFAPQDPTGVADPARGIREFVVGTGGKNYYPLSAPVANSEVRNAFTFGVIKFTLHPTSYDWEFIPEAGKTFTDAGHGVCHSADGARLDQSADTTSAPAATSAPAPKATPTSKGAALPFNDDFETGDISKWPENHGLLVQQQEVADGAYATRATSSGDPTFGVDRISPAQNDLYYFVRFKILSQGPNPVTLLRFRTGAGASILGLYSSNTGKLSYRNDVAGTSTVSTRIITANEWHAVQIHLHIAGDSGFAEVWFDGSRIDELSKTELLGTTPIGRVQLGDNASGRSYDVALDEVKLDTRLIDE